MSAPHFELAYVDDKGRAEYKIVPIGAMPKEAMLQRRQLMSAGVNVSAWLALASAATLGCARPSRQPDDIDRSLLTPDGVGSVCTGPAHLSPVTSLAMGGTRDFVVTSGQDSALKVWQSDGALVAKLDGGGASPAVAVAPGLDLVAAGVTGTAVVRLWQLSDASVVRNVQLLNPVQTLAFSADQRHLLAGDSEGIVHLVALASGAVIRSVQAHPEACVALTSPDGQLFHSASSASIVSWDISNGQPPRRILQLEGISALWAAPGGRYLAVGASDGFVRFCDPSGKPIHAFRAHEGAVTRFAAAPRRGWLFSGGADGVVRIWQMPGVTAIHGLPGHDSQVAGLAVSADESTLVVAGSLGGVQTWRLDDVSFGVCFLDLDSMPRSIEAVTYERTTEAGFQVRYTLPCGSPTPPGSICTCNCVPGALEPPPVEVETGSETAPCGSPIPPGAMCTCNCMTVPGQDFCSCVPVCMCMAV